MLKKIFVIPLMAFVSYLTGGVLPAQTGMPPEYYGIKLRSLNDGIMMQMPENPDAWALRRDEVRRRILVAAGLWPMPTKTPLNPFVEKGVECDDYVVYRVTLESFPGYYVTGNLYVPKKNGREITEKVPGILYAHGHWKDARFYQHSDERMKQELESGSESFDPSGRFPHQAFCVNMARHGAVVFFYDMVGNADSIQIPHMPGHRESSKISTPWGYCSPKAELFLQNVFGLQTYNSIRTLDWFEHLPYVDAQRIGMTGASGGGTQTMILAAIDNRLAVSCPAVMVSTEMQGGCTCENAPYLRIRAGNIDFAALFAPKPLAMTTADDWTKAMPTKGFPDLKSLYEMLNASENVALFEFPHFPHNYNQPSREAMCGWFNKHLRLGAATDENGRIKETPFVPLTPEQLTVWNDAHPKTAQVGQKFECDLLDWQTNDVRAQLQCIVPNDQTSLSEFRRVVGGAMQTIVDRHACCSASDSVSNPVSGFSSDSCSETSSDIATGHTKTNNGDVNGDVKVDANAKADAQPSRHVIILVTGAHLTADQATVAEPTWESVLMQSPTATTIQKAFPESTVVPLALTGQVLQNEMTRAPLVTKDGEEDVRTVYQYLYTYGYNDPVFVQRARQIIDAVETARQQAKDAQPPLTVTLIGIDGAGKWAALAASQMPGEIDNLVLDTAGFRFENLTAVDDIDFLPGGAKYFDLPGMIALCAPTRMLLVGEPELPNIVAATYNAEHASKQITCETKNLTSSEKVGTVIDWLHRFEPQ